MSFSWVSVLLVAVGILKVCSGLSFPGMKNASGFHDLVHKAPSLCMHSVSEMYIRQVGKESNVGLAWWIKIAFAGKLGTLSLRISKEAQSRFRRIAWKRLC